MTNKESFRERQDSELEVIKSIFGQDVEDLRPRGPWKPLDIRIMLIPLRGSSGNDEAYVKTYLHIVCPSKYPKLLPKIFLEETKGISKTLIDELLEKLQEQANSLKGEVMIFELAQAVQAFLHLHNKPPRGSFYDEMLQGQQKREKEQLDLQLIKETRERQNILDEVQRRKEIFKNESKRRGEPRRSISESNRHGSSSESSENSSPYYRGHVGSNRCAEHRCSDTLYFPKIGRQIKRGSCLGHSQKGCTAFTGMDLDTGQLLYVTEWSVKYSQIEAKCPSACYWSGEPKCTGHKVDDLTGFIEKHVSNLSQLHHKNLIPYECVVCLKRKECIMVYVVQDFVLGTSVFSVSSVLGWCTDSARMVAKGILDALIFLHNKGVSHDNLFDTSVFVDNGGCVRCTDFSLVPNLIELIGGHKASQGDLPALGSLIESLMPTMPFEMADFVEKCNSDRTLSASELLEHPFLRASILHNENSVIMPSIRNQNGNRITPDPADRRRQTLAVPSLNADRSLAPNFNILSMPVNTSRLANEFVFLSALGKGAFGDVLKCRNNLDNREYAIKRIPLPARSRQLYKKMTREVELLSRLNHENVVRYFNSWIECTTDLYELDKGSQSDWSASHESLQRISPAPVESEESSSDDWKRFMPNLDDSDDGIEFCGSDGEAAVYDEDTTTDEIVEKIASPRPLIQVMYIQMEFCEKCTLRTAIDDKLYEDTERLWRLFREILEGLSHIHQQGIIHRDLKPVNIFLDSRDQIKIGDFGLATTSFLALQSQQEIQNTNTTLTDEGTGTGKVGTTLYVAPELTEKASKSTYGQKVDMYTLGIILFEMSNPPFGTGMERVKTIISMRSPAITIPEYFLNDSKYEKTVEIIRWLLDHDPAKRPTAEELLASHLVPPAPLEANELQEMLRHVLANPQSKAYKHLVARCLQQESDEVLELTYNLGLVTMNPVFEFVKAKVVNLFRKHGAYEVDSPLLAPFSHDDFVFCNPVKLMTHSGGVVVLPNDLRATFVRHIAMSGKNMVRRYSVNRVYREQKVFNFHPKQNYLCAFDIITPNPGSNLVDAELLSIAFEITSEIPSLKEKLISIRINHTNLLKAILMHCNVPKAKHIELFANFLDFIDGRLSKFHFGSFLTSIMETSRSAPTLLSDLLLVDYYLVGGPRGSAEGSALKVLIRSKGEVLSLTRGALGELDSVASLVQSFGVTYPIRICPGLPISFERASAGGVVWQMEITDIKPGRTTRRCVLAAGERYDSMLLAFQKQAQGCNVNIPNRGISGAGLSISLDRLVAAAGSNSNAESRAIDVGICVVGDQPSQGIVIQILKLLWSAGIRSGVVEANGPDEAQDLAKELGAVHVILAGDGGGLRVRSWNNERFQERYVTQTEVVQYIQKLLKPDTHATVDYTTQLMSAFNTTSSNASIKNSNFINQLPNVQFQFLTHEKLTATVRRRLENQVVTLMSSTLHQFVKKGNFNVLVVDLPPSPINAIVGAINPREITKKETEQEICNVIERFPKHKRSISDICDEIVKILSEKNNAPIVALYSITEPYYRVII